MHASNDSLVGNLSQSTLEALEALSVAKVAAELYFTNNTTSKLKFLAFYTTFRQEKYKINILDAV